MGAIAGIIGGVAGLTSIAGGISGMAGGGSGGGSGGSSVPAAQMYQPYNQAGVDKNLNSIMDSMYGTASSYPGSVIPQFTSAVGNITNNPYASAAQTGTNFAGQVTTQKGLDNLQGAGMLYGQGTAATAGMNQLNAQLQSLQPSALTPLQWQGALQQAGLNSALLQDQLAAQVRDAGQSVWNTAQDPQSALYNRTQQQLVDQMNATNAMNGVAGSPYAAGLTNQGLSNFNIDWQNNQLSRQLQGLSGLTGANNAAGGLFQGAFNTLNAGDQGAAALGTTAINDALGISNSIGNLYNQSTANLGRTLSGYSDLTNMGVQELQQGAQLPYQTYLGQQNDTLAGLSALNSGVLGAYGLPQELANNYQSYLGLGQSAGANALNAQNSAFQRNQILGSNVGSGLGQLSSSLGSLFGPSSTPGYVYSGYSTPWGYTPGVDNVDSSYTPIALPQ